MAGKLVRSVTFRCTPSEEKCIRIAARREGILPSQLVRRNFISGARLAYPMPDSSRRRELEDALQIIRNQFKIIEQMIHEGGKT